MKQLVLESNGGQRVTTSLRIAEKFAISHRVVMKAILRARKAGMEKEFRAVRQNLTAPVFGEVKQNRIYLVTKTGLLRIGPEFENEDVLKEFLLSFDGTETQG